MKTKINRIYFGFSLSLQEEFAGVVARRRTDCPIGRVEVVDSLRGRMGEYPSGMLRDPRGRRWVEFIETWRGCLRVCWRNLSTVPKGDDMETVDKI